MDEEDRLFEARMKEYEALRNEILRMNERNDSRFAIVWAGIGVFLSVGALSEVPEIAFLAVVVAFVGWWDSIRVRDAYDRLGAYIEVNLERNIEGLNWETVIQRSRIGNSPHGTIRKSILSRHSLTYLGALIGMLIVGLFPHSAEYNPSRLLALAGLTFLALLGEVYLRRNTASFLSGRKFYMTLYDLSGNDIKDVQDLHPNENSERRPGRMDPHSSD